MKKIILSTILFSICCLLVSLPNVEAVEYTYSYIPVGSTAYGINNNGLVATVGGYIYNITNNTYSAFNYGMPLDINDSGHIAGWGSPVGSYFYDGNSYNALNYPGATETRAYGINNNDSIVGHYFNNNIDNGFFYDGTSYTSLSFPGAVKTEAYGINDTNDIVGIYYLSDSVRRGFLYDGTTYTSIEVPGAALTEAFDINNNGIIAGWYQNKTGDTYNTYGFIYDGTTYETFDPPGDTYAVLGINDSGVIVGRTNNKPFYAIPVSTPVVPEPISSTLFVVGVGVLAGRRYFRRNK